jgi:hypothetical protein
MALTQAVVSKKWPIILLCYFTGLAWHAQLANFKLKFLAVAWLLIAGYSVLTKLADPYLNRLPLVPRLAVEAAGYAALPYMVSLLTAGVPPGLGDRLLAPGLTLLYLGWVAATQIPWLACLGALYLGDLLVILAMPKQAWLTGVIQVYLLASLLFIKRAKPAAALRVGHGLLALLLGLMVLMNFHFGLRDQLILTGLISVVTGLRVKLLWPGKEELRQGAQPRPQQVT